MVRYTGIQAKLNNLSASGGAYVSALVGDVINFDVQGQGDTYQQPNLGNPWYTDIGMSLLRPTLQLTYHPQNTSFLHSYLIVQTGCNLSSCLMGYYANSADYGVLVYAMPSRVELRQERNQPLTVRATLLGLQWSTGINTSSASFVVSSTEPPVATDVTEVKLLDAAVEVRDLSTLWRRWSFTLDYRTQQIHSGTGVLPTDVLEGVHDVNGEIEYSLTNASQILQYAQNASVLNVKLAIQAAPMSSCYYVYSAVIRDSITRVEGVGVQIGRISFHGKFVTRSSM